MAKAQLTPEYIGRDPVTGTGIYRIDLSASGLTSVKSITIQDDNVISGNAGGSSGFDIDFINLIPLSTNDITAASTAPTASPFNFTSGVFYTAGFVQPSTDPADGTVLNGTDNNQYNLLALHPSTLHKEDGARLSLGEGGYVTFELRQDVQTSGNFLYFGDSGGGNDGAIVWVSDLPGGVPGGTGTSGGVGTGGGTGGTGGGTGGTGGSTGSIPSGPAGFSLVGTAGADSIRLGIGANAHIGAGDDMIQGLAGNDWLAGAGGNDRLYGGAGKDKLVGGLGDDRLYGGKGLDTLYGGMGKDAFVFNTKAGATNWDALKDFKSVDDSIWLENSVFKGLKRGGSEDAPMALKKGAFFVGDAAHDAGDRIIYSKSTGALYYDADGTGAAAQVKFAQVKPNSKVFFHDFFIV